MCASDVTEDVVSYDKNDSADSFQCVVMMLAKVRGKLNASHNVISV